MSGRRKRKPTRSELDCAVEAVVGDDADGHVVEDVVRRKGLRPHVFFCYFDATVGSHITSADHCSAVRPCLLVTARENVRRHMAPQNLLPHYYLISYSARIFSSHSKHTIMV